MPRNLLSRVLKRDTRPQQRSKAGRRRLLLESLEHRRLLAVTGAFDLTTGVLDISITDTATPGEVNDANLIGDGIQFFIDANDNGLFDTGEASGPIAALRQVNVSGGSGQVGNFSWIGDFSSAPMELGDSGGFVISVSNVHSVSLEATLNAAGNVHVSGVSVGVSGQITASSPSGSGVVIHATQQAFVSGSVLASVASDESSAASPLALPSVTIIGEHVMLAGATIDVSAVGGGGTVTVTGNEVNLVGADINASGVNGAGEIFIGGGFQGNDPNIRNARNAFIDASSVITADALQTGDGGTVIVWSDGHTDFFGNISNQGTPLGRGGFTEVSGKQTLRYAGSVNTGRGMLLLDPTDFTINAGTDAQTNSSIGADTLVTELGNNNVTLQTTAAGTDDGDITVSADVLWNSTNSLTLLAHRNIAFNASVQNSNLTGGDINVVAGWDGTTPFDATTFLAADVNTTTLFANTAGSIVIGSSTQTTGVAVGSRHGDTNVFSHDLILRGSDTNLAYAQLGFHDVTGQGLETGSVITTGDINAALTGRLDAQAGSSPGFIRDTAQTSSYVQLGHGGNRTESQRFLSLFNYTGNVTLSVKEDINFTAGNANSVYSQLGHGGSTARGSHSGLITITQANDLTFKAGNGLNAYSQLGHGGVAAGEFGSGGIHTGIITITQANDLTFMAGDGNNAYSQLGHGGRDARGSSSGLITITQANDLTLMAGNGAEAYSQLGHGGVRADGNRSGEIDVTLAGDLTLTGVNTARQYALVGHGDEPGDPDQNNTVAGNVSLRAGGNVTLTNAFLGHLIDNNGTYTSGNTLLGVRGDLTADANSQVFSAAPAQNGELRFYVGGQDLVDPNTVLNGVAHGGTPFPNNQGNFAFGAGPYNPAPNTNFAYYMVTIEDRSFIVTIPTDTVDAFDHETSLREAVDFANLNPGADTITFDASLANQTIPITLGQIVVTETGADNRTTINGPSGGIVISGNNATRPIQINGGVFATLDGLTFVDGYADQGGAIVNLGDLTVSNSTFRNNFADTNAGASGGVGGAISNLGVLNVSNSLFDLNRGELGGAINSSNGLTVTDSTFTSNVAIFNGGGLRSFGTTIISESTFSNNQAANGGGGLINHGDLTIVNSTLAHNTALDGGGLQVFGGTAELTHVTVAYNTATRAGGGLAANVSTVTATNTIIAGNSAPNQNDVWGNLAPTSSFNLLNQSAATAGLGTFGDNGGLTQTVALLTGSPALDAGTNTVALPEFDQRGTGFARIAGGGVDIGAFELQNQAPVFTSPATADVPENTQAVLALSASDPDVPAQTITFSVAGSGADNDKFEIVSGDQLRFKAAPDFETPQDVGGIAAGDNVYEVTVSAADGNGGVTNQVIAVTVIDTDEIAPTLASFTRQVPSQMLTNSDVLQFRLAFSEFVQNVDPTDFVVNGGSSASVTEVVPVQGTGEVIYLLTVSGGDLATFNGPVGIDLAAAQNITDPAGNPLPTVEPAIDETYTLDTIAPQVGGVIIDDGRSQRSVVRSITINFDSAIIFDAGAFELKTFGGATITVQTDVVPGVATNQVVLSFPGTIGGSLADGDYRLRILDTHVRDAAGNTLDGDGNGNPGAARVDEFFRFFGDFDGDRDVDDRDFLAFRRSYRRGASDSLFESAFDFDGDGDVDGSDFVQFRRNYRRSL